MTIGTADRRQDVVDSGMYDIYIEIDCDCEELVDACGLDYKRTEDDDTQNEICISLDKDEFINEFQGLYTQGLDILNNLNEQDLGAMLLNPELGEYVTKVTIYKPTGDIITFY